MKVLIVEDETMLADLIVRGLSAEGWSVTHASNAEHAVVLMQQISFDVLVLDRMLPTKSGTELCIELREQGNHTPILMLTALGDLGDKVAGLNAGADDYMSKPFEFEELIARLSALARRAGPYRKIQPSAVLSYGGLVFCPDSLLMKLDGTTLDLTAKERELLVCFMQNPNIALSREDILDLVWGENADPFSNIVDVYIGKLRKKLGPCSVHIDTVWGAGYRMTNQVDS